jgi:2-polyprenyl-3-methyl-5-hydroxy-6-metoxy-1,4-benzoquinol methylase
MESVTVKTDLNIGELLNQYALEKEQKKNNLFRYKISSYIKYEFGCFADEVKKALEKSLVYSYIKQWDRFSSSDKLLSLDIGCATGRYPSWLASLGFFAYGYDIEDAAIKICRERTSSLANVRFEKRNILIDEVEREKFDLVTCMMGTFNHIPLDKRQMFLKKIYDTLTPRGLLLFSSWNPECPYLDYLQFYSRKEREHLNQNLTRSDEIAALLEVCNLRLGAIEHFCFLPNECYHSWEGELNMENFMEIDRDLKGKLSSTSSQMYLVLAKKENNRGIYGYNR